MVYSTKRDNAPAPLESTIYSFIKQVLNQCLFKPIISPSFTITSERSGLTIFHKSINFNSRTVLGNAVSVEGNKPITYADLTRFTFSAPISYNIDLLSNYENISLLQRSFITQDQSYHDVLDALYDLMDGTCKVINHQLVYLPRVEENREQIIVPMQMASSAVKSLVLIEQYIRYIAKKGDLLIIDEPVQNLFISNQSKLVTLLSLLINAGLNILITTHSDNILRELNNRIMLSANVRQKEAIMAHAVISHKEILKEEQVKAYFTHSNHKLQQAQVNKFGISLPEIEDQITQSSNTFDDIYYAIAD